MMLATLALAVPMGCFIPDDKHCSDMIPVGQPFPNYTKNCPDQAYTDPVVTTILAAYPNQPGHRADDADCWVMWYSGVQLYNGCHYPPINDPPDEGVLQQSHPTYSTPTGDACTGT
jgi:hypothetical protein